jgi:hypothetical protein
MENGRVFEIINQVIQQAFHHGFGNASFPILKQTLLDKIM